jgi:hypothetical protein
MLMFISLYDTGFLDLMGLTGLAFAKARTLLRALPDIFSQILIVLRGTSASTAQLQPSCRSFFWVTPHFLLPALKVQNIYFYINSY